MAPLNLYSGGTHESGAEGGIGGRGWLIQPSPVNEKALKQSKVNGMICV